MARPAWSRRCPTTCPKGEVTDFYRAVKAEDGEKVVFSFIEWPDKATRDEAWEKIMADESLKPEGDMPFDGQRMFWGGFEPIVDTAKATRAGERLTGASRLPRKGTDHVRSDRRARRATEASGKLARCRAAISGTS